MEEEFVQNQERLKPQEEKNQVRKKNISFGSQCEKNSKQTPCCLNVKQEERTRVDELRGTPMTVGSLEEIIDDEHAIVSASSSGTEYYVSIMSYVDKDLLEPSCSILLHHKVWRPC